VQPVVCYTVGIEIKFNNTGRKKDQGEKLSDTPLSRGWVILLS